jgi:hypothetical protein
VKRIWFVLLFLLFSACSGVGEHKPESPAPTITRTVYPAEEGSRHTAAKAALKLVPEQAVSPTIPPVPEPAPPFEVITHPDGPLFVGDRISLEVVARDGDDGEDRRVDVRRADTGELLVEGESFHPFGIGGRDQATLTWVWDTYGLEGGDYELVFSIQPDGVRWSEWLTLYPPDRKPVGERTAGWRSVSTDCCNIHYITGTPADRDMERLVELVDREVENASRVMGYKPGKPLSITFFPRVLGHGGFARSDISVAYLDRNYAGSSPGIILHHEVVHALDSRIGGELRPTILSEGLAVYLSGGHFKREPLSPRAAALLEPSPACLVKLTAFAAGPDSPACGLGWFLPLEGLSDNFYFSQHEIGYLEAAALVDYMIDTWGWERFMEFYRDIHPRHSSDNHSAALDQALRAHFDTALEELQAGFIAALRVQEPESEHILDVRYSVAFYNAVREYQELLDPSAYFLTAWLPDNARMREFGILGDYLRHPVKLENIALETMLVEADFYLDIGEYDTGAELLAAVRAVLDGIQAGSDRPFDEDPTAADYYAIAEALQNAGMDPNRISLKDDQARAWVSHSGPEISKIDLIATVGGWSFTSEAGY